MEPWESDEDIATIRPTSATGMRRNNLMCLCTHRVGRWGPLRSVWRLCLILCAHVTSGLPLVTCTAVCSDATMNVRLKKSAALKEKPAWKRAMEAAERGEEPMPVLQVEACIKTNDAKRSHDAHNKRKESRSRSRERDSEFRRSRSRERESEFRRSRSRERDDDFRRSRSRERREHRERDDGNSGSPFIPANSFGGYRQGYVFKRGRDGVGYYPDIGSEASASAAEDDVYQDALKGADDTSPDAPILAALSSHTAGLDDAERACTGLEEEARGTGGRASAALRHRAEIVEVRLTDQLLMLTTMLDDCTTAEGRTVVKRSVTRLKALGQRALRISQGV